MFQDALLWQVANCRPATAGLARPPACAAWPSWLGNRLPNLSKNFAYSRHSLPQVADPSEKRWQGNCPYLKARGL